MSENKITEDQKPHDEKSIDTGDYKRTEKELIGRPKSNLDAVEEQAAEVAAGGTEVAGNNNDEKGKKGGTGVGPVTQNGS